MFFILPSSPPFYQASFTSLLLKDWGSLVEFKINAQSKFTLLEVTINLAACQKNLSQTEVKTTGTGKSFSEALILASTNKQLGKRASSEATTPTLITIYIF